MKNTVFFRIGLLPIVAVESFQLEIAKPERAAYSFGQIQNWIKSTSGVTRTELRRVTLTIGSAAQLTCDRVRLSSHGDWELLDGVTLREGVTELHAARATLRISGPDTGRVLLRNNSFGFLFTNSDTHSSIKESPR